MSTTLIYSELLSNIRQISILAEISTPSDSHTQVSLSPDRKHLALAHNGLITKLALPGSVSSSYIPQQPAPGLRQISWRIPLTPQPPQARPDFAESASAPWSASDLDSASSLSCRTCAACIVPAGKISVWQDLPSANWAEMMDFWHCHKPDVPKVEQNGVDSGLVEKGYGANASFRAQKGMGKVDLMTFLFSKQDCSVSMPDGSETLPADLETPTSCLCSRCSSILGAFDSSLADVRLNKWALVLNASSTPPLSYFLIPYLISQTAALAVSKFVIHDTTVVSKSINIFVWLFAPNLSVSFASGDQETSSPPLRASKLFYRVVENQEAVRLIDAADASIEEVKLADSEVAALLNTLKESTQHLPSSARKFGEWEVGILSRSD